MKKDSGLLRAIALFKFVKALTLIAVGVGALHLIHNNAVDALTHLLTTLGLNPGDRLLDHALAKVSNIPPKDFKDFSIGSFIYAALFLTEGIGLWLMKRWAEYFTAIITTSLVPLEIFELHRHPSPSKAVILVLNLAIVVYLILRIRNERSKPQRS